MPSAWDSTRSTTILGTSNLNGEVRSAQTREPLGSNAVRPSAVSASALRRCVGDPDVFADTFWGTLPLHQSGDPERFAGLLELTDVDSILSSGARRPQVRVVSDGNNLPASKFCTPILLGGKQVQDVVDVLKVRQCLADGATVVLQSLHRTWPSIARLTTELERELSHTVQANAYLTPSAAAGLAPHCDSHDVIVIQLAGSKMWSVDGLDEFRIGVGDTLYIPAGVKHSARTSLEFSLHLTIGILRRTYRSVVERLLADHSLLDTPLPIGYDRNGSELAAHLRLILSSTEKFLGEADPLRLATQTIERRRNRTYREGEIVSVLRVGPVGLNTTVRLADHEAAVVIHPTEPGDPGQRIDVTLGDRTLSLPVSTLAALERLCDGSTCVVGALPGLSDVSRVVLAKRLVKEKMIVVVEPSDQSDH